MSLVDHLILVWTTCYWSQKPGWVARAEFLVHTLTYSLKFCDFHVDIEENISEHPCNVPGARPTISFGAITGV